ncbi:MULTISPECIES: DUF3472 domain-containing protein [Chitinophagaceae]
MKKSLWFGLGVMLTSFNYSCSKTQQELSTYKGGLSVTATTATTGGAAPSMHLNQYYSTQSVLKMQKIKVDQTAYTEYFEVNNFTNGYSGLQHTPDSASVGGSTSKTLIASLWDPNTAGGVHAMASYIGQGTVYSRFGGEGDGAKTLNPYGWKVGFWYNVAHRGWKSKDSVYVANFIQDVSQGTWFLTSVLSAPGTSELLGSYDDSFLENWDGSSSANDGSVPRKAFFKDCWALDASGNWMKPTSRNVSINTSAADSARNGIYNNSFDANYNSTEDAFYMAHGAGVIPSSIFNGTRSATLPSQTNQGSAPSLGTVSISGVSASNSNGVTTVNWAIPNTSAPQFSATVEILNSSNSVVATYIDTVPQRRSLSFSPLLSTGTYTARVTVRDIFNRQSASVTQTFNATASGLVANAIYTIQPSCAIGRSLDVDYSGTADGSNVSIYSTTNNANQQWKLVDVGNGYYKLLSVNAPTKALDVANGGTVSGTNVQIYADNGSDKQKWKITSLGNGYYKLQPANAPTLCLDAYSGADANENVEIYTDNGGNAQKWKFTFISN